MRIDDVPSEGAKANRPVLIHVVHILDGSGSMSGSKYRSAIEGIKGELALLFCANTDPNISYTMTIVEFAGVGGDNSIHEHMFMVPVDSKLTFSGCGANGGTPLFETIHKVANKVLTKKGDEDRVLLSIFTDGEENTSRPEYSDPKLLKDFIERIQYKNKFTVTFVGTEHDVDEMVRSIHISRGNTLSHNNTVESIKMSYHKRSQSLATYSKAVSGGQDIVLNFFESENK